MNVKNSDYKDLLVWQKSRYLIKIAYPLARKLPMEERFALSDQIRRALISISSNIAEGHEQGSDQAFIRYLYIARGSAAEAESQLILCQDLGYLSLEEVGPVIRMLTEIRKMLNGLIHRIQEDNRKAEILRRPDRQ